MRRRPPWWICPPPQHLTTFRPSCAIAARSGQATPKIPIVWRSGMRTAGVSSAGRRGRCEVLPRKKRPRRPQHHLLLNPERRHEQRRRHRHLPQHLHDLHQFRVRPDQRRGRLPCLDADRDRHHARRALLGLGRGRGHSATAGEEDPLRRRLRLSSSPTSTTSRQSSSTASRASD